jgi:hypothetical protein
MGTQESLSFLEAAAQKSIVLDVPMTGPLAELRLPVQPQIVTG